MAREIIGPWASLVAVSAFGLSVIIAVGAVTRWARNEIALRTGDGLPSPWIAGIVVAALIAGAIVGVLVTVISMT